MPVKIESMSGSGDTSTNAHCPAASHSAMFQPSEIILLRMSSGVSSKVTKTPGSPRCRIPSARNCVTKTVFALPAVPETSVARPFGNPPYEIWSNPVMPVGSFSITAKAPQVRCSGVQLFARYLIVCKNSQMMQTTLDHLNTRTPLMVCALYERGGPPDASKERSLKKAGGIFYFSEKITKPQGYRAVVENYYGQASSFGGQTV